MKFHESHYEDYNNAVKENNFHPELLLQYESFPIELKDFHNLIIYGPVGVGKYSQMIHIIKRYSPSGLKYEKKITATIEKQSYTYKISDIHYEVDMALLGCNSKLLWFEIFQQIVDIVSIKSNKHGIIVCKNFHLIHNELLESFYSYIQQYSGVNNLIMDSIKIKFIFITEHISFISNQLMDNFYFLSVSRPSKEVYLSGLKMERSDVSQTIQMEDIVNAKEIYSFDNIKNIKDIPVDNFNIICDDIIEEMILCNNSTKNGNAIDMIKFRDKLYDILIYNLDASECIWYIFSYFTNHDYIQQENMKLLMEKIYLFLKQYGNNYRAIFHIECICITMITLFHKESISLGK